MNIRVLNIKDQEEIKSFTAFCCSYLDIQPRSIEIDALEQPGINGMCIDLEPGYFLILLKEHDKKLSTLAHELVHVKQYIKQDLGSQLDSRDFNYEECWWEVEARSNNLVNKYNEYFDSQR